MGIEAVPKFANVAKAGPKPEGSDKSPFRMWILLGLMLLCIGFWSAIGYGAWFLMQGR
jgi:hypothetical protein